MRIAVIPARGGSKRIPRKNVKNFCESPRLLGLLKPTVACRCFSKVIVSTDDYEIADVAKENGAEVPFMRPAELSDDYTGTIPVVRHAIEWVQAHIGNVEFACCIYATAPLLPRKISGKGCDISEARNIDCF